MIGQIDRVCRDCCVREGDDFRGSEGGDFVHAAAVGGGSMNDPCAGTAEAAQDIGVDRGQAGIEDTNELMRGLERIEEGTDDIEDRAGTRGREESADTGDCLEGRVVLRGEEKGRAMPLDAFGKAFRGQIDGDSKRFKDVGSA